MKPMALQQGHGLHALDGAAHGVAGAEHLLDGALELLREALVPHLPRNVEDDTLRQVAAVLDVLGLLAVAERLLQRLDDEAGGVGLHVDLGLAILDRQAHGDADALPLAGALHNVIANLLRGHAQRADLGRKTDEGACSPPYWRSVTIFTSLGSNLGAMASCCFSLARRASRLLPR